MNNISKIVLSTRRTGNTTWILKSAIKNPECIIVSRTQPESDVLRKMYFRLLLKQSFFKKLGGNIFGRKTPYFRSLNEDFSGLKLPVVFDNGALI